jgi:hypothetical protein
MSLPPQWQKWAIPLMQYGVRFSELGHTGGSNRALPRQKRRHHGDDQEDGPASERKTAGLFPPPALGERRHRCLARSLIAVRYAAQFARAPAPDICDPHHAVLQHGVVVAPASRWAAHRSAFENEVRHCLIYLVRTIRRRRRRIGTPPHRWGQGGARNVPPLQRAHVFEGQQVNGSISGDVPAVQKKKAALLPSPGRTPPSQPRASPREGTALIGFEFYRHEESNQLQEGGRTGFENRAGQHPSRASA